jgi:hypothetical protein
MGYTWTIPTKSDSSTAFSAECQHQISSESVYLLWTYTGGHLHLILHFMQWTPKNFSGRPSRNENMALCVREDHKSKICGHWPSGNQLLGIVRAVALYGHVVKEHSHLLDASGRQQAPARCRPCVLHKPHVPHVWFGNPFNTIFSYPLLARKAQLEGRVPRSLRMFRVWNYSTDIEEIWYWASTTKAVGRIWIYVPIGKFLTLRTVLIKLCR